jgi:orotidine-5'-phosphate decarboxylase
MPEAKDRLIFALDVPTKAQALELVQELRDEVGLFKVGLELYLSEGPQLLQDLISEGQISPGRIFLDLKVYDIPATVLGAIRSVLHGLAMFTMPSDLGRAALTQIISAAGTARNILAVTVLTSVSTADLEDLGYRPEYFQDPKELVLARARMAREVGCRGVVCSGREARAVREACGDKDLRGEKFLIVCPGIRPAWSLVAGDDQSRIVTPQEAIRHGADFIVVGRPIRTAPDPVAAARQVVAEIAAALER